MPKGYVIFTEDVRDEAGLNTYAGKALPTLMPHGGTLIALDDKPDVREGEWHGNRTVVLEFESVNAARAGYESPEYQDAIPLRQAVADCNVAIVSGFEMLR